MPTRPRQAEIQSRIDGPCYWFRIPEARAEQADPKQKWCNDAVPYTGPETSRSGIGQFVLGIRSGNCEYIGHCHSTITLCVLEEYPS